jgi:hypothetical protein
MDLKNDVCLSVKTVSPTTIDFVDIRFIGNQRLTTLTSL